jgi:hypothetical protein
MPYLLFVFLIFLLNSCNQNPEQVFIDNQQIDSETSDTLSFTKAKQFRFQEYELTDSNGSNNNFMQVLIPSGWDFNYYSYWDFEDKENRFKYGFIASDTSKIQSFTLYPTLSYFSSSTGLVTDEQKNKRNKKYGINYTNEIAATAVDAIKKNLIPYFRPELENNYTVIDYKPLKSNSIISGKIGDSKEAGMLRIEYNQGENKIEEIFYASMSKSFNATDGYTSECNWQIHYAISYRNLKGNLDDYIGVNQTIINSIQYDKDWAVKYHYTKNQIGVNDLNQASIQRLFFNAPVPQTKEEIDVTDYLQLDLLRSLYNYCLDNVNIESYVKANGSVLLLPTGYSVCYTDDNSEYYISEKSSDYPSDTTNKKWIEVKKNSDVLSGYVLFNQEPLQ